MTTPEIEYQPEPKKPPDPGMIFASFLELAVTFVLISYLPDRKAIFGLVLCAVYGWRYSACRAYVHYHLKD